MRVLVTGASGYIGSHTVLELLSHGHEVVGIDNFSNSSIESINRVQEITGKSVEFLEIDIRNRRDLSPLLNDGGIDAVIHFAGLKAVGESVEKPALYRENNVYGTFNLLDAMNEAGVKNLVFSSSSTVYGDVKNNPVGESHPRSATNPYGQTKLDIEKMCQARSKEDVSWRIALLRYFNPVGAHSSGLIGEDPTGMPNNLMPFVMQTAVGRRQLVNIWGKDYPTPDGTCIRDYIHVVDLALGHIAALEHIEKFSRAQAVNLGTGKGYSVLEVINAASRVVGKPIPYLFSGRRAGDAAEIWADPSLAKEMLGWSAARDLDTMCADSWNWQSKNPDGYLVNSK